MFRSMQKTKNSALDFQKKMKRWYTLHHRKLPWRQTEDPYKIWISEIMLQQTTVQAVIPYYQDWLKIFPDVRILGQAPLQKVLRAWQGLGYYTRAKNLHRASKIILEKYDGCIPQRYEDLIKIPGFGPYTTAAVLSFAFDKPHPVMDANVRRVSMRLMRMYGEPSPKKDKELLSLLAPLLPQKGMGIFNQAIMELGSLVCRPQNPLCLNCPIPEYCKSFKKGDQEIIPQPKIRKYKKIEAVVGVIKKHGKYLIQKRPSKGLLGDLWEFPGGKIETNEHPQEALKREIKEELGVEVSPGELLITVQHAYTQFRVKLYAYSCSLESVLKRSTGNYRWVTLKSMRNFPFPSGSVKIVKYLEEKEKQRNSK